MIRWQRPHARDIAQPLRGLAIVALLAAFAAGVGAVLATAIAALF
jgi:hypothetical protein